MIWVHHLTTALSAYCVWPFQVLGTQQGPDLAEFTCWPTLLSERHLMFAFISTSLLSLRVWTGLLSLLMTCMIPSSPLYTVTHLPGKGLESLSGSIFASGCRILSVGYVLSTKHPPITRSEEGLSSPPTATLSSMSQLGFFVCFVLEARSQYIFQTGLELTV